MNKRGLYTCVSLRLSAILFFDLMENKQPYSFFNAEKHLCILASLRDSLRKLH